MKIGDILFGILHTTDSNVQLISKLEEAISPKIHSLIRKYNVMYTDVENRTLNLYMCVCVCNYLICLCFIKETLNNKNEATKSLTEK